MAEEKKEKDPYAGLDEETIKRNEEATKRWTITEPGAGDPYPGLDDETKKRNAEAMKRVDESRPTPTQAEMDAVVLGHLKPETEEERAAKKAKAEAAEQKTAAAEEPKASYKTRTVKSAEEK
jgi:hypothetical protein